MNKKTIAITIITVFIVAAMVSGLLFVSWIEKVYSVPGNQNSQGEIRAATSYEEIYRLVMSSQPQNNNFINKILGNQYYIWDDEDYDEYDDEVNEFYEKDYSVYSEMGSDFSYGDNVAEKDGYIYSVSYSESFTIYDTNNNFKKTEVSTDTMDYTLSIVEANVYQDYLILVGASSLNTNEETVVLVYDISDPINPVKVSENTQYGVFDSSIIKDGYLYIDTMCWEYDFSEENCVPVINGFDVAATDIYYVGAVNMPYYNVLTSMNLNNPQTYNDEIAVIGNGTEKYCSENAFYFSAANDNHGSEIIKFTYDNGKFEPVGSASVEGSIVDSFSMNEYGGNLRVYTRNDNEKASIYVFDGEMNLFGMTDDVKINNTINTIRFMGNSAVIIEYSNDETLCTINLTDPSSPKIKDSDKLNGFTGYIYMIDNSRAVSVYMENDYLKVSEFDISDPENIEEMDYLILEKYNYSASMAYGRLVSVDSENSRIGFSVENTDNYDSYVVDYILVSFNEVSGLENIYNSNVYDSNVDGDDYSYIGSDISYDTRAVRLGQSLYLFTAGLKATEIEYENFLVKNIFDLFVEDLF